jgi:pyruvate dehydrogenase E2 component (dihydrolipoamide acetyltransferase)
MRKAIASRLHESKSTVPHFYVTRDIRMDALLELRRQINSAQSVKVSVNDLVLKGVAHALQDVPAANAVWGDTATRHFEAVDVAVAISLEDGLITPVVRDLASKSVTEISLEVSGLAERARAGRLRQNEIEGGAFTVSNLGMFGVREFSAIINPPHSGILAVGAAERRAVVREDGGLEAATIMTVTLSADHRVLDGVAAAQWLSAFAKRLENPVSILL